MALYARSLTGEEVTLAAGNPAPVLPASGEPVNVTSKLKDLSTEDQDALEAQRPGTVAYWWTSGSSEYTLGGVTASSGSGTGGNIVVWSPDPEGAPAGSYTNWDDAVAALNAITAPITYLYIHAPNGTTVDIPGGTHELNNTIIVGNKSGSDTDSDFRGYQDLLLVTTAGNSTNPTWIKGCAGLKDLFFRQQDYDGLNVGGNDWSVTGFAEGVWTGTNGSEGYVFTSKDVGKFIRIGHVAPYQTGGTEASTTENNNTFRILGVDGDHTIRYELFNGGDGGASPDANNGSIIWSLCTSTFMVGPDANGLDFDLDCVDFRYGGDTNWGSMFVSAGANVYIHLRRHSSIRWFSLTLDGDAIIESDSSGCWVGSIAFAGNGHAEVFAMSDTEVRTWQPAINTWTLHQGSTVYLPSNTGDWAEGSPPATIHEALNRLAAACVAAGHTP